MSSDDIRQSQEELKKINKELKALQARLAKKNKETSTQEKALREVEVEMGLIQVAIRESLSDIAKQEELLDQLQKDIKALQDRLNDKKDDIEFVLRLAYKQNNQSLIKILLNGERPEDLSRHLYYFSVLTQNQLQQVEAWIAEQDLLAETLNSEKNALEALQAQKTQLSDQQATLQSQMDKRAKIIANLALEAKETTAQIDRKEQERQKMAELIAELEAKLEQMKLAYPEVEAIGKSEGKLPWPVEGRLTNGYGRSIEGNSLRWQGWLIEAPSGAAVKSVHSGRIIFADFFKSNGLLIIVDHGNGIWTLYGRNRALLRDVGSWVNAGDVIAEVGQSGGYSQSGLYFEVRNNGEPVNPASWLKKR